MARRSDPARLDHARKAGVRSRLIAAGIRAADVDAWLAAWEAAAPALKVESGSPDFWNAGATWIQIQVAPAVDGEEDSGA